MNGPPARDAAPEWRDVALPVGLALATAGLSLLVLGPAAIGLVLATLGGLWLYQRTFRHGLPPAKHLLPLYLSALAWQLLHFFEEFATGLQRELPALVGLEAWTDLRFLALNLCHYALFLLAAIALVLGFRPLTWFASFFVVVTLLNGVAHPLLALVVGGYFPGLWTGWMGLVWGLLLLGRLRVPTPEHAPEHSPG